MIYRYKLLSKDKYIIIPEELYLSGLIELECQPGTHVWKIYNELYPEVDDKFYGDERVDGYTAEELINQGSIPLVFCEKCGEVGRILSKDRKNHKEKIQNNYKERNRILDRDEYSFITDEIILRIGKRKAVKIRLEDDILVHW